MTRSANGYENDRVTRLRLILVRLAPVLFLVAVALIVAACLPGTGGGSGSPGASPSFSQAPLEPAKPSDTPPMGLLAWLFTPIFQVLFIALVFFDQLTRIIWPGGQIAIAIILLTVVLKVVTTPISKKQLVSSRQTQLLQPEIKEIQRKYKGDRVKQQAATQEFYKQRGINPAGGCLPMLLTMGLLIPMYSVISQGLTNYDPSAMWNVFGFNLFPGIECPTAPVFDAAGNVTNACLNPVVAGQFAWGLPEPYTTGLFVLGFGVSILAIVSSLFQLVASRQMLAPVDPRMADDQNVKVQRQMAYFLPLISILYGGIMPAGLFLYWIASTIIQIGQQYLVLGWGGTFPLFGWHPAFAKAHTPRYHVTLPLPKPAAPGQTTSAAERSKAVDRDLSARSTIRPNRSRGGRRGRRR
jgi:YidC/Oxa1 family membrane protein insertase